MYIYIIQPPTHGLGGPMPRLNSNGWMFVMSEIMNKTWARSRLHDRVSYYGRRCPVTWDGVKT